MVSSRGLDDESMITLYARPDSRHLTGPLTSIGQKVLILHTINRLFRFRGNPCGGPVISIEEVVKGDRGRESGGLKTGGGGGCGVNKL